METLQNGLLPKHHILATKLRIPALAGGIVERPRLYALLEQARCQALTVLSAPQGFGKTTLVADWLRRTQTDLSYAWVSLTQHDNELRVFWSYIFAAVGDAVSDSTDLFAELSNTSQCHGVEAALIHWLNALNERDEPLVIVIDNYQRITSPALNNSLAFVVEHLPQQVHVMLLTNHEPPLPLPRWRARGLITEIYADALSYVTDEASRFLATSDLRCPPDDIAAVIQDAEGWFAGLRLLSAAWKQANHIPHVAETSGSYVYEYVQNEVLADQPPEIRAFLLHTCVLDDMCTELCDALLDTGEGGRVTLSQHMLRTLERRNLFLVPLDGSRRSYRYHRLFREALRYLLQLEQPELFDTLLQRASAWYLSNNRLDKQLLVEPQSKQLLEREVGVVAPVNNSQIGLLPQPVLPDMPAQDLSPREHEVLALIAEGASNHEIADKLVLSLHTVKRHASNILAKLNAANRTQAVAFARAYGVFRQSKQHATTPQEYEYDL